MLEVYNLYDSSNMPFIQITYNNGKLSATKLGNTDFANFWFEYNEIMDDRMVRGFISSRIAPPTREDIADILKMAGMSHYDDWELFKRVYSTRSKFLHFYLERVK